MADLYVSFDGDDPDTAELARLALQPVLDAVYRAHAGSSQSEIELILRRAGRGSFARVNIAQFARYIARGDRPVLSETATVLSTRTGHVRETPAQWD